MINRKGRIGNWDYYNTNGLGLMEFLLWCEDMNMSPVVAVFAGFTLDLQHYTGTSYPPDAMQGVLDEALGMLEYIMGDVSTQYGAWRARDGHPKPFNVKYVSLQV